MPDFATASTASEHLAALAGAGLGRRRLDPALALAAVLAGALVVGALAAALAGAGVRALALHLGVLRLGGGVLGLVAAGREQSRERGRDEGSLVSHHLSLC